MVAAETRKSPFEEVLRRAAEKGEGERVKKLLDAAAEAIGSLADLDLSQYEAESHDEGGQDLAAFNEIAPMLGQTLQAVQGLLAVVEETFPVSESGGEGDLDDLDFGEAKGHIDEEPVWDQPAPARAAEPEPKGPGDPVAEATEFIHAVSGGLRSDMAELGRRVREPTVVANRWNLDIELQAFRGKMRAGAGEIVFRLCSAFAPVKRAEVVPGYRDEQKNGALLRRTLMALYYEIDGLNRRVQSHDAADLPVLLPPVRDALERFAAGPAWTYLRPGDRKSFLDFRKLLGELVAQPRGAKEQIEGLAKFMESLAIVNRRETLVEFDRQALASAARKLEAADELLDRDPEAAAAELEEAFKRVRAVFGRDMALDRLISEWARKMPDPGLGIAELKERIASVPGL